MVHRTRSSLICAILAIGSAACLSAAPQSNGQTATASPSRTVLDGVYSRQQASRGESTFLMRCASCHASDLSGFSGPPLKGDAFIDRWREFSLRLLSDLMRNTMPKDSPGTLPDDALLDVLAYILQINGLPGGSEQLTDRTLDDTLLVGKEGHQPLPSSAPVSVVGCLILDSTDGWFVTKATEPARTLDPFALSAEETETAKQRRLGSQRFKLALGNFVGASPEPLMDMRILVKGILVRQANNERLNVTQLTAAGAACEE